MIEIAPRRRHLAAAATALLLLASLLTPARADAQRSSAGGAGTRPITIGIGGGASVPTTGSVKDALKTGVNWHGFVGFRPIMGMPMLRLAADYQKFDFKKDALIAAATGGATTTATTTVTDAQTKVLGGLANLGFDLLHGPVRPYVLAGVGAFNVKTEGDDATGQSFSRSKTQFGIDGGAGIAVNIGPIAAFVEGRVQNVYTDKGAIDTKTITTVPVTFGVQF
ncbi:MAG TPA: outer membrane beta-barrel protein [Gemmatimonadaceae bacterium]|nr:outer membrane beta-barrel protein [Gemmatimonadaceae bacterium]